jgi:hypothetical protein
MNYFIRLAALTVILISCNSGKTNSVKTSPLVNDVNETNVSFFPVTAYIKGQLYEIKNKGINPLKYTTVNNRTDSVWLKLNEMEMAVQEFLTPVIDSQNLSNLFLEKKFLDQTIDAFTFTYEPIQQLPDSFQLQRWDVYIDPETNKVKRIYMLKEKENNITLQLTWQSGKYCKILTILRQPNGKEIIEKEEKMTWDF